MKGDIEVPDLGVCWRAIKLTVEAPSVLQSIQPTHIAYRFPRNHVYTYVSPRRSRPEEYSGRHSVSDQLKPLLCGLTEPLASRSGFPKKEETFYFFEILDATKFRQDLRKLIPDIKNVAQVLENREEICEHKKEHPDGPLCPFIGVNIAFSHFGFKKVSNMYWGLL